MAEWDLWDLGRSRRTEPWIQGLEGTAADLWRDLAADLDPASFSSDPETPQRVLLMAKSPRVFLRYLVLANALAQRSPLWLFLGNPDWAIAEQRQVMAQVNPHHVWGDRPVPPNPGDCPRASGGDFLQPDQSYVGIATGGSSGTLRFAMHTWESLWASVSGFRQYFDAELDDQRVHSFCTLPLFHVSGLMQFLRSAWSGGIFQGGRYPSGKTPTYPPLAWQTSDSPSGFLSLVPTQLVRLLDHPPAIAWLRQFHVILLGGAPAWPDLLERSRQARLPLAPTYGMTETAAQVATLKPHAFLQGQCGVGHPLPHVTLKSPPSPDPTPITLSTPALAVGYWGGPAITAPWTTGDLGRIGDDGSLRILGRRDDTILSGGENVLPQEVEAAIIATGQAADVCVVGLPDPEWGQRVAALWVPRFPGTPPTLDQWQNLLSDRLSRYKHPKTWHPVPRIPRNSRGKVNRTAIAQTLHSKLQNDKLQNDLPP